jgi:hypothetical protein
MACSGCAARREAIKAVARNVGVSVSKAVSALRQLSPGAPPVVERKGEDAGRKAISRRK